VLGPRIYATWKRTMRCNRNGLQITPLFFYYHYLPLHYALHYLTTLHTFNSPPLKFSKEPLIPIGCVTTAYFLGSGIRSFYDRDASRSQKMMRARVGAQFATLLIFMGYAGMESINFAIAPGYHPKDEEEKK
jgi:hypothetical protein